MKAALCAGPTSILSSRPYESTRAFITVKGGAEVKAPKTKANVRCLALDADSLRVLESLRAEQQGTADGCGVKLGPESFVLLVRSRRHGAA